MLIKTPLMKKTMLSIGLILFSLINTNAQTKLEWEK